VGRAFSPCEAFQASQRLAGLKGRPQPERLPYPSMKVTLLISLSVVTP